ncbi:excinuclease ABC subunit UvrC [Ponticaulis sp.]|uniref:excinuclease ABC subunit UvrC n=1 Tax=Ponticaulis sp. TaxID=2020902 RepID=UPI000B69F0AE|nr:excinuclease ABC subunit UvrC [Ponticaulis sp.]MAJ08703.1 excinuclease ABC subunit C [Ponticaulis sp.]RPG17407.1 MAG: excinuclease ABC subunit UvrC [Hyphomonadaceae bacterium TMED125]
MAHNNSQPVRPNGVEVIKDNLPRLPGKPGVYRMFGADGEVLYVGKAKNLKNRVSNYAKLGGHTQRIALMISLTASMEFVVTETETEALLLEANLIKRLKPRFNILLRDDKSFPYILIRRDHPAPQILKYRGSKKHKGDYFGPFASAGSVTRTLDTLQKAFLLRTCEDTVFEQRSRPCMLHQIKRCAAPCVDLISEKDYQALADQAADFLRGKVVSLHEELAADMEKAAENLEFEQAARLRDRIRAIAAVRATQDINPEGVEEADVFALAVDGGQSCMQVFFYRSGQNWGTKAFYPKHERDATPEEIVAAFLVQFYDERPPPKLILTSHEPAQIELIEDALALRADRKIEVRKPSRGGKRELVVQALNNAREALSRKLAETASQARLLEEVRKVFDLPETPKRIEAYDNSHIQGSNAVGGMIVAGPEGFEKNQYRKFNIKDSDIEPGDDYGMMREVMRRRFSRLMKEAGLDTPSPTSKREGADGPTTEGQGNVVEQENKTALSATHREGEAEAGGQNKENTSSTDASSPDSKSKREGAAAPASAGNSSEQNQSRRDKLKSSPNYPDLVLIDGGLGQLHAVMETLQELGLSHEDVTLVSIAKGPDRNAGREKFFRPDKAPFMLPETAPVLYYLQRLRDEVHRWAIGAHRTRRSADIRKNPLDEIEGIGPARKKALLHRFGSAKAIARAKLSDIATVDGVSQALAERIYNYFHGS